MIPAPCIGVFPAGAQEERQAMSPVQIPGPQNQWAPSVSTIEWCLVYDTKVEGLVVQQEIIGVID